MLGLPRLKGIRQKRKRAVDLCQRILSSSVIVVAPKGLRQGRPEDTDRNNGIAAMLRKGVSWNDIQDATDCSRAAIAKIAARVKAAA